jgi:TRAP-type uncharacterized transport system fused permease subunit
LAGTPPQYAAALAILTAAVLLFFNASGIAPATDPAAFFVGRHHHAGQQIAMIAAIILCASIIIGVLAITGLGVKITSLIIDLSGGWLWLSLLLTALACLVLGMEVPTTAAYVICVSVAGPACSLGCAVAGAPVRVLVRAAVDHHAAGLRRSVHCAGMIGENWLRVAVHAMMLGVGLYIIPLTMVANPARPRCIGS